MSILDLINNKEEWKSFYNYKIEKGHLNKKEENCFEVSIAYLYKR